MRTSPNDSRQYKSVQLQNGLRALLICDKNASKSAAALTVNVGHFDDPPERQGLAHFLEHMLFLGTKKYPKAGEYQQFINHHGGSHNAWTGTEFTNYFFDIENNWFNDALDRFCQFFIAPCFDPQLVEKERQAVHSEYLLKLQDDVRRLYQVHKETINPQHPFSKFSVGSVETLADWPDKSIRNDLLNFYQTYYSSEQMTLVILSNQSLETLTSWSERFNDIPRHDCPIRTNVPLLREQDRGIAIYAHPVKEIQRLTMSFDFSDLSHLYKSKPLGFLAHLLGYEGSESLIAYLRHKGLIQTMSAGGGISGKGFREFTLSFQLTDQGFKQIDLIIEATFDYLSLISNQGLEQWRYLEKQRVMERAWSYQEKIRAIDQVSHLAVNMHHFDESDILIGDYLMEHFDKIQIQSLLSQMTAKRMRLTIISQQVETDRIAKWYQTPYKVVPFSDKQLEHWLNPRPFELLLPPANPFIGSSPTQLLATEGASDRPRKLIEEPGFRLWYQQDSEFKIPKGHIYLSVDSAFSVQSIDHIVRSRFAVEMLLDHLTETTYQAEIAGMSYQIYAHQGGYTIHTAGFNERQLELLKMILNERLFGHFDPGRFDIIKQQLHQHWHNQTQIKPINQLFHQLTAALQPNNPTGAELNQALKTVTREEMPEFIKHLYANIHIETLIYGNWSKRQAIEIGEYLQRELAPDSQPSTETPRQLINISGQQTLRYHLHCEHPDSSLLMYFQSASIETKQIALFTFCNHLMSSTFFYELRTQQQLGYIVGNGNLPLNRHPGMIFYIQSPHATPFHMVQAIDRFLDSFPEVIATLSEEEWQEAKHGLASQILEQESNMRTRAQRYWISIGNKDENFNQRDLVVDSLMKLTKEELILFTTTLKDPIRDRILLYTTGSSHEEEHPLNIGEPIQNMTHFHEEMPHFSY
ncbi:MAG: Protease 3 [Candidatus Celerinatantimonas neptuna]|nr:MAG: Protease 3 [Candidatus Celerinatantimonas neptuna]